MFVKALEHAIKFTRPLIIVKKLYSGKIELTCGTFFVINPEGWALTASHMLQFAKEAKMHEKQIEEFETKLGIIKDNYSLNSKQRRQKLQEFNRHPDWIVDYTAWWGKDDIDIEESVYGSNETDLALVKLTNFDSDDYHAYPTFLDPSDNLTPGTSVCRLGFPFPSINANYDEQAETINISQHSQLHPFPNDGIITRLVRTIDVTTKAEATFIETSTPGLMGQSGGPVLDVYGNICGLQSRTINVPLGFSPHVERDGKKVVEHQFMNLGHASHVQEIVKLLNAVRVSFQRTGART
jgi:hypothetical protein